MPNFLLIDASYFCFYRYYAIYQWFKLAKSEEILNNPIENNIFIEKFEKTFNEKFNEIAVKLNIDNPIIIVGKDCHRKDIVISKEVQFLKRYGMIIYFKKQGLS